MRGTDYLVIGAGIMGLSVSRELNKRCPGARVSILEKEQVHGSRTLDPGSGPTAPYKIYNIGNHSTVQLMDFIGVLEDALSRKTEKNMLPMQPGDVAATYADVDDLMKDVDYSPSTSIRDGINKFVKWYQSYIS